MILRGKAYISHSRREKYLRGWTVDRGIIIFSRYSVAQQLNGTYLVPGTGLAEGPMNSLVLGLANLLPWYRGTVGTW
jgi:hypothetical protein